MNPESDPMMHNLSHVAERKKMGVPFSGHFTANLARPNNIHRLKIFKAFMGELKGEVLDVGAPNFIGKSLGITDFTRGDLNKTFRAPKEKYDVITCFEVVNHVMNQLFLLENIHAHLKEGGRLYLSTPKLWLFAFPHGKGNYVELYPRSLRLMLEYAGFKIVREKTCNPWPLKFIFYGFTAPFRMLLSKQTREEQKNPSTKQRFSWWLGFKPVARYLLNRFILVECEKI